MELGELIEYNIVAFLFKIHAQNVVKKLFPDLFVKNENWAYL